MAIACFRLVTFFPLPERSLPRLNSCISRSTFLPAEGEYLRPEDFFEELFLELVLLREELFAEVRLLELPDFFFEVLLRELLFFDVLLLPDFFFAAFLVAIHYPPGKLR